MDYFKLSLVLLISFEFLNVVSTNPITGLFGKSDDKAGADDKADTASSIAKSAAGGTTTTEPSSSCGGLKGFLHICDKTETAEPPKSVKTRSVADESDSDSDSDESESDEDKKSSDVTVSSPSGGSESTEGGVAKRQADETSEAPESEETPAPEELPLGLKKRQVEESDSNSESESDEEDSKRKRRDCRDGPEDGWKDCKK